MAEGRERFVILTGGPGAGKSTLLAALARAGHPTYAEAGRAVLQRLRADGDPDLPARDPERFGRLMLERDLASYAAAAATAAAADGGADADRRRWHFFDHAIPCLAGYFRLVDRPLPASVDQAIRENRYQATVFVAPPWRAIYRQDAERRQTWVEAHQVHAALVATYPAYGYRLVELPLGSVEERVAFVLRTLEGVVPEPPDR